MYTGEKKKERKRKIKAGNEIKASLTRFPSPFLFFLSINDVSLFIKALCELFADDTTVHSNYSDVNNLSPSLQKKSTTNPLQGTELKQVYLKSYKTKCMTITTRQKPPKHLLAC